jgi:hypothetical protein
MMNAIKTFFEHRVFGIDPNKGEPIDLSMGKLRIKSTCEPDEPLDYNKFWQHVYEENKKQALGKS